MKNVSLRALLGVVTAFVAFLAGPEVGALIGGNATTIIMIVGTVLAAASPQVVAIVDEHEGVGYTAIISVMAGVFAALSHEDVIRVMPESVQHIVMLLAPVLAAMAPKMLGKNVGTGK